MKSLMFALILVSAACEAGPEPFTGLEPAAVILEGESCTPLLVKGAHPAGEVCLETHKDVLRVTYRTEGKWRLDRAHLWVGADLESLPVDRTGHPMFDFFPYRKDPPAMVGTLVIEVPLPELGQDPDEAGCAPRDVVILAHAEVLRELPGGGIQRLAAYGQGTPLADDGRGVSTFRRALACDGYTAPEPWCAVAFARGSQGPSCFLDAPILSDRWGWTNGPLSPGTHTMDLYADAVHCDVSLERRVGTVKVVFDGKTSRVTYQALDGLYFEKTHLYVGAEPLPRDASGKVTTDPGDYPFIHAPVGAPVDEFQLTGLEGRAYVAAHAVVCKPPRPVQ